MLSQSITSQEVEKVSLKEMIDGLILRLKNLELKVLGLEKELSKEWMDYAELKTIMEAKVEGLG